MPTDNQNNTPTTTLPESTVPAAAGSSSAPISHIPVIEDKAKEGAFILMNAMITSLTYFVTYIVLSPFIIAFYALRCIDDIYQDYKNIYALNEKIEAEKDQVEKDKLFTQQKSAILRGIANTVIATGLLASVVLLSMAGLWFVGAIVMIVSSSLSVGHDVVNAFLNGQIKTETEKAIHKNTTATMLLATTCIGFFVPNILAAPIMLGLYAIHTLYNVYENISDIHKTKKALKEGLNDSTLSEEDKKSLKDRSENSLQYHRTALLTNAFTAIAIIAAASLLLIPGVAPAIILTMVGMITFLIAKDTIPGMLFETEKAAKPRLEGLFKNTPSGGSESAVTPAVTPEKITPQIK